MKGSEGQLTAKRTWSRPEVTEYGTLADLTAVQHVGSVTDQAFPAGTPVNDLTFSSPH